MKRFIVLAALLVAFVPAASKAVPESGCRYLVRFDPSMQLTEQRQALKGAGATTVQMLRLANGAGITLPNCSPARLLHMRGVLSVEHDYRIQAIPEGAQTHNNPVARPEGPTWNVEAVNAPRIWSMSRGEGIKIAILDTGIVFRHPDLKRNIVGSYNAVRSSNPAYDGNGHGTKVASIIASDDGMLGIAPKAKIYAVKVLDNLGWGTTAELVEGINWAVEQRVNIIHMSLGGYPDTSMLRLTIEQAAQNGVLVIVAAGNSGVDFASSITFPGAYTDAISVGAVRRDKKHAPFSSVGAELDIAAPGRYTIASDFYRDGKWKLIKRQKDELVRKWVFTSPPKIHYSTFTGTSAAAPHVTGVAALLWSLHSNWTAAQVRLCLEQNAEDRGLPGWDKEYGIGFVNAERAAQECIS